MWQWVYVAIDAAVPIALTVFALNRKWFDNRAIQHWREKHKGKSEVNRDMEEDLKHTLSNHLWARMHGGFMNGGNIAAYLLLAWAMAMTGILCFRLPDGTVPLLLAYCLLGIECSIIVPMVASERYLTISVDAEQKETAQSELKLYEQAPLVVTDSAISIVRMDSVSERSLSLVSE